MRRRIGAVLFCCLIVFGIPALKRASAEGEGAVPDPSAQPKDGVGEDGWVLEIQEVETVRRGRNETRTIYYTVEFAVRPESAFSFSAAVGNTGVCADGAAGKIEAGVLQIRLKGEMLEVLSEDRMPSGVKAPAFNSREFAIDGRIEVGKRTAIGMVEDTNKVVNITTYLGLKRGQEPKALIERLKEHTSK